MHMPKPPARAASILGKGGQMAARGFRILLIFVAAVAPCAAAPLAVGISWAPGFALAPAQDYVFCPMGLTAQVTVPLRHGFALTASGRYTVYKYEYNNLLKYPEEEWLLAIPVAAITVGTEYTLPLPLAPFIGGGAGYGFAFQDLEYKDQTDAAPAFYGEAGARVKLNRNWAVVVAPRYTYFRNAPVVKYHAGHETYHRTPYESQFLDFPVGVSYSF